MEGGREGVFPDKEDSVMGEGGPCRLPWGFFSGPQFPSGAGWKCSELPPEVGTSGVLSPGEAPSGL